MANSWEEFYGFKTGYEGKSKDGTNIWEPSGQYGIGFGGGDLRKGFNSGYTATEMLKYLGDQNYEAKGVIPQEIKNELRQSMSIEGALKTGFDKYKELGTSFETLSGKFDTLSGKYDDLSGQQEKNVLSISANKQAAANAQAEAMKVKDPYAITQNSALQIQSAQTPSSAAGTISAGLAGLSRGGRKFKNKTLNI